MAMKRFDMVMPEELIARVDAVRGDASRALWVRRAVERALGAEQHRAPDAAPAPSRPSDVIPARDQAMKAGMPQFRHGPKRDVRPIPKAGK